MPGPDSVRLQLLLHHDSLQAAQSSTLVVEQRGRNLSELFVRRAPTPILLLAAAAERSSTHATSSCAITVQLHSPLPFSQKFPYSVFFGNSILTLSSHGIKAPRCAKGSSHENHHHSKLSTTFGVPASRFVIPNDFCSAGGHRPIWSRQALN